MDESEGETESVTCCIYLYIYYAKSERVRNVENKRAKLSKVAKLKDFAMHSMILVYNIHGCCYFEKDFSRFFFGAFIHVSACFVTAPSLRVCVCA